MKITFLSGGTGTPKLIRGFRRILDDQEIAVVVNTAEDLWLAGNHLSPDIDTVMYLFAGLLNTKTWWGIEGDTTNTDEFLQRLDEDSFIGVGDQDRAVHIARGEMLRRGMTLTESTRVLCNRLGVGATVLPMCDDPVTTMIRTPAGLIHFQEFWIRHRATVPILEVVRESEKTPTATTDVLKAIRSADLVVLGPSNPVTSIGPILECNGVREALKEVFVVVVSPFIGDAPVSGPAKVLMEAWGLEPTSRGTFTLYQEFADLCIQDIRDEEEIDGAVALDTLITDEQIAETLAGSILSIAEERQHST